MCHIIKSLHLANKLLLDKEYEEAISIYLNILATENLLKPFLLNNINLCYCNITNNDFIEDLNKYPLFREVCINLEHHTNNKINSLKSKEEQNKNFEETNETLNYSFAKSINLKFSNNETRKPYNFVTYYDLLQDIKENIDKIFNFNIKKIVGIPRSGIIPSQIIGSKINVPVLSLTEFFHGLNNDEFSHRKIKKENGKILILDDSIRSGKTMNRVRELLIDYDKESLLYGVIYCTEFSKDLVDLALKTVDSPRIFEWNFLNYHECINWAYSLDGVLCENIFEDDNEENYINNLKNALAKYIPEYKIGIIVSSRLEKYRDITEYWLWKNKVKYEHLFMVNLPSYKESRRLNANIYIKTYYYKFFTHLFLFIEENPDVAKRIAHLSHKQVLCLKDYKLITPDNKII